MTILNSEITDVTVFADRAMVTRNSKVETIGKEEIFRFENLPQNIDQNSLQVKGLGDAVLKEIKFSEIYIEISNDEEKNKFQVELKNFQYEEREINDKINQTQQEKAFLGKITEKITSSTKKSEGELNPENWNKITDFYISKLSSYDKEIRESEKQLETVKESIKKVTKEIQKTGINQNKTMKVIDVTVFSDIQTSIELKLTYIVFGAAWIPNYNLRVSSENKKAVIEYNAQIQQNTGENWTDINLILSTAKVQVSGTIPVLSTWAISKYVPQMKGMFEKAKKSMIKSESSEMEMDECEERVEMKELAKPMIQLKAEVQEKGTSFIFKIDQKSNIKSDNEKHRVSIMIDEFDTKFDYTTVPKLLQFAYLKTELINTSKYPMLAGKANIFFDNNFISETSLHLVLPDEKFVASLGVDESIKIEHKILPRFDKEEGIFSKKNKKMYEFETKIKNTKSTDETITIFDQIPVSQAEDVIVELQEPKYKEETEAVKLSKQGILERKFVLKSRSEIVIPLKFFVEFPRDISVTGL